MFFDNLINLQLTYLSSKVFHAQQMLTNMKVEKLLNPVVNELDLNEVTSMQNDINGHETNVKG